MEKKIDPNNIGYKLLKAMGWKEGNPLGKKNQGLLEPIKIDIESKITKEANKNYKGKKNKKSKNNFTLSSFKSKLYNSKEAQSLKKINENDKLNNVCKENQINLYKGKNIDEEKKIKTNLSILVNLIYNKYFIEHEKEYLFLKNTIEQTFKRINDDKFDLCDEINKFQPLNYNICKLLEITERIESFINTKLKFNNTDGVYFDDDVIMQDINDKNQNDSNQFNFQNDIYNLMSILLELETFIFAKNLKALTEEIIYLSLNNNIYEEEKDDSYDFCIKYFKSIDKLSDFLQKIITNVFFYCSKCCINFLNYGELKNHLQKDCEQDLSDN